MTEDLSPEQTRAEPGAPAPSPMGQLIRYCLIGVTGASLDAVLFWLMTRAGVYYQLANFISVTCGAGVSVASGAGVSVTAAGASASANRSGGRAVSSAPAKAKGRRSSARRREKSFRMGANTPYSIGYNVHYTIDH